MAMVGHNTAKRWNMYTKTVFVHYGSQMDIAREEDLRTHGNETWKKKFGTTGWTGDRWKLLHKTGKDGNVWSLAYAPLGVKRLKRSKQLKLGYSQIFQVRGSCPMLSHSPYMPMLHACRTASPFDNYWFSHCLQQHNQNVCVCRAKHSSPPSIATATWWYDVYHTCYQV